VFAFTATLVSFHGPGTEAVGTPEIGQHET
jgi:hypothetical protein